MRKYNRLNEVANTLYIELVISFHLSQMKTHIAPLSHVQISMFALGSVSQDGNALTRFWHLTRSRRFVALSKIFIGCPIRTA